MAIEALKNIWPEWQIEEKPLGTGSYGVVYKAVRREYNVESYAAIKVITIPSNASEIDSLRSEGLGTEEINDYFKNVVDDFIGEIQLMETLKGVQNIVNVEDYKVIKKENEIGWEIYIRMELLTPLNSCFLRKPISEEEVIKLGCDICTALEICGQCNVIHRDIKPENIFINDFGHFKLGDFGIARKLENATMVLSQKGTYNYMAPEIAKNSEYDNRADIYSLGLVLYRLLNDNKMPFIYTDKQFLNPNERKNAVDRRIQGELLPSPCDASPQMADIILRACSYDPNKRFASASEMKQALISVADNKYKTEDDLDKTLGIGETPFNYDETISVRKAVPINYQNNKKSSSATVKYVLISIIAILVLAGSAFASFLLVKNFNKDILNIFTTYQEETQKNEGSSKNEIGDKEDKNEESKDSSNATVESSKPTSYKKITDFYSSIADIKSSSQLQTEKDGNRIYTYSPWNVVDNDFATCWSEGETEQGIGESITVELNDTYSIRTIKIWNGLHINESMYYKNSRIRDVMITLSNGEKFKTVLNDSFKDGACEITLPYDVATSSVTITINSVYEGTKFKDTCITEMIIS